MSRIKTVPICQNYELMLISALRYAIGRETYMPDITINYIKTKVPYHSANTLIVMSRDIEEEVARYERIKHELYIKKQWLDLKSEIDDEYAMKKEKK